MYNNAVVWCRSRIGKVEDGVAKLNVTGEDFVSKGFKFHEAQDIVHHLGEIIEALQKKGYRVEIKQMPETHPGAFRRAFDTRY